MELSDFREILLREANDDLQSIGKEIQDNPHCEELMAKLKKSLFRLASQIQEIVEEARRQDAEDDDDFDDDDDDDVDEEDGSAI